MPTYFDPITQEHLTISSEQETQLYLVKQDLENYKIHAVSSGLTRLVKDPATSATEYWLIEEVDVFISKVNDNELNDILFPNDSLTTHNLPLALFNHLDIHPEINEPKSFSREMAETLRRENSAYLSHLAMDNNHDFSSLLPILEHLSEEQIGRIMTESLNNDSEQAINNQVLAIGSRIESRSRSMFSGLGFFAVRNQSSTGDEGVELVDALRSSLS